MSDQPKYTPEALAAAYEIESHEEIYTICEHRDKRVNRRAAIIDKHTAAPEQQAKIDRLEASLDVRKRICRDVVAEKAELLLMVKSLIEVIVEDWGWRERLRRLNRAHALILSVATDISERKQPLPLSPKPSYRRNRKP